MVIKMKCYACGYEKFQKFVNVAEVKRFKNGKRKGEIKEVKEDRVDVFKDDPEFVEVLVAKGSVETHIRDNSFGWGSDGYEQVTIYACPQCGTLKINEEYL